MYSGQLLKRITALQTLRSKLKTASFFLHKVSNPHAVYMYVLKYKMLQVSICSALFPVFVTCFLSPPIKLKYMPLLLFPNSSCSALLCCFAEIDMHALTFFYLHSLSLPTPLSVSFVALQWHTSVLAGCWQFMWQAGRTTRRLGRIALYSLFQGTVYACTPHGWVQYAWVQLSIILPPLLMVLPPPPFFLHRLDTLSSILSPNSSPFLSLSQVGGPCEQGASLLTFLSSLAWERYPSSPPSHLPHPLPQWSWVWLLDNTDPETLANHLPSSPALSAHWTRGWPW